MHPTEKTEQAMRESGLPPWMDKAGPNGWKAEFVESYRQIPTATVNQSGIGNCPTRLRDAN